MAAAVLLAIALCAVAVQAQDIFIGELTTEAHSVSGSFYIVDNQTALITNFNYDGLGPDTYLYFYMEQYRERGPVEEGRGVKIALNNETTAFKVGAQFAYNGSSNLTITLPENWYMCDFSWFTIWCETASVFFSRLEIPTTAFVENADDVVPGNNTQCTDTRARRWISAGMLPTLAHEASGELYIINNRDAVVTNFNYDGRGPGAYLYFFGTEYVDKGPYEHGGGLKMPVYGGNPDGSFLHSGTTGSDTSYTNATFYIFLPDNWYWCDFSWFTIWCEDFWQFFTKLQMDPTIFVEPDVDPTLGETVRCSNPKDRRWQYVGALPTLAHGVSGDFYLISNRTAAIVNFNYDGRGPAAFQYFYEHTFTEVDEYGGGVKIPVDSSFSSDPSGSFDLGTNSEDKSYTDVMFYIFMPNQWNFCDFAYFTIWCEDFNQTFTMSVIPLVTWVTSESRYLPGDNLFCFPQSAIEFTSVNSQYDMYETPRSKLWVYVGELPTLAHEVSGHLWIADRKTLIITDFTYDGRGPAAYLYFYDTTYAKPDEFGGGVKIDISSTQATFDNTEYDKNLFVIHLPDGVDTDVCDFAWFTIWCLDFNQTFTEVNIPRSIFVDKEEDAELGKTIVCDVPEIDAGGAGVPVVASLLSVAVLALLSSIFA